MIDIQPELFDMFSKALRETFPSVRVTSEPSRLPSQFPAVSFVEFDSFTASKYKDSSGIEKFINVTYKVDVFSNKPSGKETECRKIMNFIGDWLYALNFRRESQTPGMPIQNGTIFWMSARYTAVTDGENFYGK